jgi:hypothetical protein
MLQRNSDSYLTIQSLVASIQYWYLVATEEHLTAAHEGNQWYANARRFCQKLSRKYGLELQRAVAVVAVLSPGTWWSANCRDADSVCKLGIRAKVTTYGQNLLKATALLSGARAEDVLGGRKVKAFAHCILHGSRSRQVCLDRHAVRIACPWVATAAEAARVLSWAGSYDTIAQAYRQVADEHGIAPHQLQATVWIAYRDLAEIKGWN